MKKIMALMGIFLAVAAGAEEQVKLEGPVAKKMDALFLKRVFGSRRRDAFTKRLSMPSARITTTRARAMWGGRRARGFGRASTGARRCFPRPW